MCVHLTEYYVTKVLKQGINIKTMCPNYILKHVLHCWSLLV